MNTYAVCTFAYTNEQTRTMDAHEARIYLASRGMKGLHLCRFESQESGDFSGFGASVYMNNEAINVLCTSYPDATNDPHTFSIEAQETFSDFAKALRFAHGWTIAG